MIKFLAIIQARMNSTRLPNKVLATFSGNTLMGHIINRISHSKFIDRIVVATGNSATNQDIISFCLDKNISCISGPDDDVLARFHNVAKEYSPEYIIRITADDPFKDPTIIDLAISYILSDSELDYVSNTITPTYPEGLDIEVFKTSALNRAYNQATTNSEREHVTPYIWKNHNLFKIYNFEYQENLSYLRWTIDYPEDLEFTKQIYNYFADKPIFLMQDILDFLEMRGDKGRTSEHVTRNEAYLKGIKDEVPTN